MNNNFDIAIVQQSGGIYFWALRRVEPYEVLATSRILDAKHIIEKQAQEIADEFELVIMVEER